jgi:hypothetical protein
MGVLVVGQGRVFLFCFEPLRREACPELVEGDAKGRGFFLIGVADQEKVRRCAQDFFYSAALVDLPQLPPNT